MTGGRRNRVNKSKRTFQTLLSTYIPKTNADARKQVRILKRYPDGVREAKMSRVERIRRG